MYSKEVIKLTPACNEALKKLSEKECPRCEGLGHAIRKLLSETKTPKQRKCDNCNGTGRVGGWTWQPQTGDIFEYRWNEINEKYKRVWHKKMEIVPFEFQIWSDEDGRYMAFGEPANYSSRRHYFLPNCTPIIPWETIEKILEGMGYRMEEPFEVPGGEYGVTIRKRGIVMVNGFGKDRQTAVMKAVIEAGKEVK